MASSYNIIIANELTIINSVFFFYHYLGCKYRYSNLLTIFVMSVITYIEYNFLMQATLFRIIITISTLFLIIYFFYQGSLMRRIAAPLILLTGASLSECIISLVFNADVAIIYTSKYYLFYALLDNLTLTLIICFVLKIDTKVNSKQVNAFYNVFIIALLPFILGISILLLSKNDNIFWQGSWIYLIFILIFWGVIDYQLYRQAKELETVVKEEIVMTKINQYYQQTLLRYIEIKKDSDDYRKIRHDLINYIERIKMEDNHE